MIEIRLTPEDLKNLADQGVVIILTTLDAIKWPEEKPNE